MCFVYFSSDKLYIVGLLCGKPVDAVDNDMHLDDSIYNHIYTQCWCAVNFHYF